MDYFFLGISVFLACTVEMIEALTIILAVGTSRDWRSTFAGAVCAVATLVIAVLLFRPFLQRAALEQNSEIIKNLWLIAGSLILIFGLQWLKKSILRFTGLLPIHNENTKYERVRQQATKTHRSERKRIDYYAFVLAYKGVLLEGLEVIFIVLTFGAVEGNVDLGIKAAAIAFLFVFLLGLALHRPLARLPENTMKFAVGIILVTFGTYFATRGTGVIWPRGADSIGGLLVFYLLMSLGLIALIKSERSKLSTQKSQ